MKITSNSTRAAVPSGLRIAPRVSCINCGIAFRPSITLTGIGLAAGGAVLVEESSGARSVGGAGLGATTSFCSARMLDESRASGPAAGSLRDRILVVMFAW